MRALTVVASLVAAVAAVVAAALTAIRNAPEFASSLATPFYGWPPLRGDFEPVAPSSPLLALHLPVYFTPFHAFPLDIFALQVDEASNAWLISDAGSPDTPLQSHATETVAAVTRLLARVSTLRKAATLSHILLSHGHWDHVGALHSLLDAFPSSVVVFHEAEADMTLHGTSWENHTWKDASYGGVGARLAGATVYPPEPNVLRPFPADRAVLLTGTSGAVPGVPALTWHHTPGHAPSHIVMSIPALKLLLGGDVADVISDPARDVPLPDGRVLRKGVPGAYTLAYLRGADRAAADASLCRVAHDVEGVPYDLILPYHNALRRPIPRAEFARLADGAAGGCPEWTGKSI